MFYFKEAIKKRLSSPKLLGKLIALIPGLWMVFFLLLPFMIVLGISLTHGVVAIPPYEPLLSWINHKFVVIKISFENYIFLFSESLYIRAYLHSLILAGTTTLCCLLLGYPVAYGITRLPAKYHYVFLTITVMPFWISFLVRIYAWVGLLSAEGLINSCLMSWGLISEPLLLMGNSWSVLLGMIYAYLPFMILPLYNALEKIDPALLEAAYDLGCRPIRAFWNIVVPLSYRGVLTGAILVFIPTVGEFVIPEILGGAKMLMIGQLIWNEFFYNRDWPLAATLAIVMLLLLVIPIYVFQRLQRTSQTAPY
jgi:putrescine transport system permease protein